MEIAVGTVVDERYEVLGRIGTGAVAVVYLCRHLQIGSLHALKVLLVPTHAVQSRLVKEGRLQGTLRDRNVVAVTDLVDVDGSPGLVMEYVRGPSLERVLQHVHFDLPQAIAIGTGMLLGVRAAHQVGMVHRDLKPANVLVEVTETTLIPKIADFGLAKLLNVDGEGATATRTGSTLGTPAYMAPEQIRDARQVDERADVFSLGAVLYEILCGRRVFPGDDLLELYDRIREGRYAPVRSLVPEIPPELERVVDDALRTERNQRISSVTELLDRWTSGRGESVLELEWSPEVLRIVAGLAPDDGRGAPTGSGGATFDFEPAPTASVDLFPAPAPPPAVRPWQRRRPWFGALAALVAGAALFGCLGGTAVVGVAMATGYIEWGPKAALPMDRSRAMYASDSVPLVSLDPAVQHQVSAAWAALRQDRPEEVLQQLEGVVTSADGRSDPGIDLLLATAMLWTGDARAYGQIDIASSLAGSRKGPVVDLARIAASGIHGGVDAERVAQHRKTWPADRLAPLLLASLDGWDVEPRAQVLKDLIADDRELAAAPVVLAELLLDRERFAEARGVIDAGLQLFPGLPRLLAARASWLLDTGDAVGARQVAEAAVANAVDVPEMMEPFGGALRMVGDEPALGAVGERVLLDGDDQRYLAFARGRVQAAFGLGAVGEATDWLGRGFSRAVAARRFDDAIALFRLEATMALLLGDRDQTALAWEHGRTVAALAGMPGGLHDRLAPRLALLEGVVAAHDGDAARVQAKLEDLRGAPSSERLASLLSLASFGLRGQPLPGEEVEGCVGLALRAGWMDQPHADPALVGAAWSALVAESSPCGSYGADRYVRARAEAALARLGAPHGDAAEVHHHLQESERWAPEADLSSALAAERATASEDLTWRDP